MIDIKSGFDELKTAYLTMAKECGFLCTDIIYADDLGADNWQINFDFFGVGIRMSFSYNYIVGNDPIFDDIIFTGDPVVHFSISCYQIITNFINTIQNNRSDKDTMDEFIDYLGDEMEKINNENSTSSQC